MVSASFQEVSDTQLIALVECPDDLGRWIKAIKLLEESNEGVTKKSDAADRELIEGLYQSLLSRFPYLENYWIKYANTKFRLGDTNNANLIYLEALKVMPYSFKLWVRYLKFLMGMSTMDYLSMKIMFKEAERHIGGHFHSAEFWELYLDLEKNLNPSEKNRKFETFLILRKVIELPIYHYAHFYSKFTNFIDSEITLKNLTIYFSPSDLNKFGISERQLKDMDDSNYAKLKEVITKIKKIFTDLYISTQYDVTKTFQYEANLKVQYFSTKVLTVQELDSWSSYLDFLEIKLLDPILNFQSSLQLQPFLSEISLKKPLFSNIIQRITLTYERCLIGTALYDRFWLRYFWFLMNIGKVADAKNVLIRASKFLPVTTLSTKVLLANLEELHGNFLTARDYLVSLLSKFPQNPHIWKPFMDCENLLFGSKSEPGEYLMSLIDQCLQNQIQSSTKEAIQFASFFSFILSYDSLSLEQNLKLFQKYYSTLFSSSLTYWLCFLKLLLFNKRSLIKVEGKNIVEKLSVEKNDSGTPLSSEDYIEVFNLAYSTLLSDSTTEETVKLENINELVNFYESTISSFGDFSGNLKHQFVSGLYELQLKSRLMSHSKNNFW